MATLQFGSASPCPAMIQEVIPEDLEKTINGTLTSIKIPSTVTNIRNYAFYNYTSLTSINLNNVITIGDSAFENNRITSISFPNNTTTIGSSAFKNNTTLTSINLNNVTTIGSNAFYGTGLQTLNISDKVRTIGQDAFGNCSSLTVINVDQNQGSISGAPWGAYKSKLYWKDSGTEEGEEIDTTLGTRIDNKATVVGVVTDENDNEFALCVVDAVYRSSSGMSWSSSWADTPIVNNTDYYTGKYNTDLILATYTATNYPAFNFARTACTVMVNGHEYYSVLPNYTELRLIYTNKSVLDQYDPTVSDYPSRSISRFTFGSSSGVWSSFEYDASHARAIGSNGTNSNDFKSSNCGVCPVILIPLKNTQE